MDTHTTFGMRIAVSVPRKASANAENSAVADVLSIRQLRLGQ